MATTDGGRHGISHTDSLATLGVSSIIVDRTNPNTLFIGTGDREAGDAGPDSECFQKHQPTGYILDSMEYRNGK